jgi:hypothetical protein
MRLLVRETAIGYALPRTGPLGRHLDRCPECREAVKRLRGEERVFRVAWRHLPIRPDFTQVILDRLILDRLDQTPMP